MPAERFYFSCLIAFCHLFSLWAAEPQAYFAGSSIHPSKLYGVQTPHAKRMECTLSKNRIAIRRETIKLPLTDRDRFTWPEFREDLTRVQLVMRISLLDAELKELAHKEFEVQLINPDLKKLLPYKISHLIASQASSSTQRGFISKLGSKKVYSLDMVKGRDAFILVSPNFDEGRWTLTKLLELARSGTTVFVTDPKGHVDLSSAAATDLTLSRKTAFFDRLPLNKASLVTRYSRPALHMTKSEKGWSWVSFQTRSANLYLLTHDLDKMANNPAPYLMIKTLLDI